MRLARTVRDPNLVYPLTGVFETWGPDGVRFAPDGSAAFDVPIVGDAADFAEVPDLTTLGRVAFDIGPAYEDPEFGGWTGNVRVYTISAPSDVLFLIGTHWESGPGEPTAESGETCPTVLDATEHPCSCWNACNPLSTRFEAGGETIELFPSQSGDVGGFTAFSWRGWSQVSGSCEDAVGSGRVYGIVKTELLP